MKNVEKLKFGGDWAELWPKNICSDNTGQDIRKKGKKSSEIGQAQKNLRSIVTYFLTAIAKV